MLHCKTASTPMNLNEKLQANDGTEYADGKQFRSMVGGLVYLTHSRPNIAYSIGVMSKFMHNPTKHHLGVAKRIM